MKMLSRPLNPKRDLKTVSHVRKSDDPRRKCTPPRARRGAARGNNIMPDDLFVNSRRRGARQRATAILCRYRRTTNWTFQSYVYELCKLEATLTR